LDTSLIAAAVAEALSMQQSALRVDVLRVSALSFAFALQGARTNLSAAGTLAARGALARALAVPESSIELLQEDLTTTTNEAGRRRLLLRRSVLASATTLHVDVLDLNASLSAAAAMASAAADSQTSAAIVASLQRDGVSGAAISQAPTMVVLFSVVSLTADALSSVSLAALLNDATNSALLNAALQAIGHLAAVIAAPAPPPPPPPALLPSLQVANATTTHAAVVIPAGAADTNELVAVAAPAGAAIAFCLIAAVAALCVRRRSQRRVEKQTRRKRMSMPVGWEEQVDEQREQAEAEEGHSRAAGLLFVSAPGRARGVSILQRIALGQTTRGGSLLRGGVGVLAADSTSRVAALLKRARRSGRRSYSLPPGRMSMPLFEDDDDGGGSNDAPCTAGLLAAAAAAAAAAAREPEEQAMAQPERPMLDLLSQRDDDDQQPPSVRAGAVLLDEDGLQQPPPLVKDNVGLLDLPSVSVPLPLWADALPLPSASRPREEEGAVLLPTGGAAAAEAVEDVSGGLLTPPPLLLMQQHAPPRALRTAPPAEEDAVDAAVRGEEETEWVETSAAATLPPM
jgi:hypothetical protein